MPICKYFQNGNCKNENCQYLHEDPRIKRNECPYYERGFCKNGLNCKNAHTEKQLCEDYLYGFCIRGPNCDKYHLKSLVSLDDDNLKMLANYGVLGGASASDLNNPNFMGGSEFGTVCTKAICHK
mmetsp:Transcript_7678/g.8677  ORF Transcript_7678/g.8677 Transcript_7678/m.8677 type:complete len:125 (+) Transcript_7678:283-657(+)